MGRTTTTTAQDAFDRDLMLTLVGIVPVTCIAIAKVYFTQKSRMSLVPYLEDCLLILSLLTTYATFFLVALLVYKPNLMLQAWKYRLEDLVQGVQFELSYSILALLVHGLVRLSLLVSLRRVLSALRRARIITRVCDVILAFETILLVVILVLAGLTSAKHSVVDSTPEQAAQARREDLQAMIMMCIIGLATDAIILLSPLPIMFELKGLSKRRMHQIVCVILFGVLTLSVSVVRLEKLVKAQSTIEQDPTEAYAAFVILTFIEIPFAILTVCLPTASVIFRWAYSDRTSAHSGHGHPSMHTNQDTQDTLSLRKTISDPHVPQNSNPFSDTNRPAPTKNVPSSTIENAEPDPVVAEQQAWSRPGTATRLNSMDEREEDDDDDNFFDSLVPSDHFFPLATALNPRPSNAVTGLRPRPSNHVV